MRDSRGPIQRMPNYWQIGLLAVVYFVAAKLSLLFAIPPGHATAVWPPSGIALAAILLLGSRIWPGVWLGAALVNYTVNSSLTLALMMGTGNALEALAGAALIRRYVGVPRRFENGRDVIIFVAIAAVSCTIAATVAVLSMTVVGLVSWPEFISNWWTWWQGDVTGIIIVTPLILSWRLRRTTLVSSEETGNVLFRIAVADCHPRGFQRRHGFPLPVSADVHDYAVHDLGGISPQPTGGDDGDGHSQRLCRPLHGKWHRSVRTLVDE